jgi:hypothetical protein
MEEISLGMTRALRTQAEKTAQKKPETGSPLQGY